jgi:hypothetical protein
MENTVGQFWSAKTYALMTKEKNHSLIQILRAQHPTSIIAKTAPYFQSC